MIQDAGSVIVVETWMAYEPIFNIGIELGQLAFIAVVAALGGLLLRLPVAALPAWRTVPVYVLGSLSAMWCIERALEVV